ncbi:MAG: hypothetical protein KDB94_06045 [Acidobacteria bacterium]|nr:hypothetical protein [Acidobacteriota bacterium]
MFDESRPGEAFVLFRLANRLHRTTRPRVIERMLLFHPGDPVSATEIAESERLLRAERYFYDVRIRPVAVDGDTVDLEVDTRDVWSLTAGVAFHRTGGANALSFELQDTNFLGLGKDVQLLYRSNVDRDEAYARYRDKSLLGTRLHLDLEAGEASDGHTGRIVLERPFYSLDSRWGVGVALSDGTEVGSRSDLGHVTDRFAARHDFAEVWGGFSPGLEGSSTHRLTFGMTWSRDRFAPAPEGFDPVGGIVPADRELIYPWVGWEWVEDGYVVLHDLDKIERSEDVNLGGEAGVRLGFAPSGWGENPGQAVVSARYRDGVRLGERNLLLVAADLGGRFGGGGTEDLLASVTLREYFRDFDNGRLLVSLRAEMAHALSFDRQLLLGGDNGLRGYPLRYQQGDRALLLSVEQRLYFDRELFHLFRVGAAAFFDVGRAWFGDRADAVGRQLGTLRDLGVGLRLGSSRSARAGMVHLDIAMPLDGPSDVAHLQWLVSTSETF